ncbi:MAG: multifunctional oxoglutarate decarboxylase/oxoglutarate dehydrogenase thiamine pyrophosphate-binding subunit/dihydrolipoyllysine-residue succinyltransferase subunit [Ornithinimicrobium sp.]
MSTASRKSSPSKTDGGDARAGAGQSSAPDFGANDWLVEEQYEQYLDDKNSVSSEWRELFDSYRPDSVNGESGSAGSSNGAAEATTERASGAQRASSSDTSASEGDDRRGSSGTKGAPRTSSKKAQETKQQSSQNGSSKESTVGEGRKKSGSDQQVSPDPQKKQAPKSSSPTPRDAQARKNVGPQGEAKVTPLRGATARVVSNMEASLAVPTATSVRSLPAKLLIDNRTVINNHLARSRGGKVSFTHLIGYAMVKALEAMPSMNNGFAEQDGKPVLVQPSHINIGLAIDVPKPDGTRQLLVPGIKSCEGMDFHDFWDAYEEVVRKARDGKLGIEDFQGISVSLTNPGGIGTVHSVPRLMQGQGAIIGVGALAYPAEWQGASPQRIAENAVSKVLTVTSTYDHRIIQGAQSGEFLKIMHSYLIGEHGFYDEIFSSLRIPYHAIAWMADVSAHHEDDVPKTSRVQELIHAYRVRGHLMADTDPLEYRQREHHDLDITNHGLTLWDLEREFATGGFGGKPRLTLRRILGILRDSYCRTVGIEYMHIQDPEQRKWIQKRIEIPYEKTSPDEQLRILRRLNAAEAFETFLQTKFVGQKRFSLEGGESVIALMDRILNAAADDGLDEVCIGMPHRGRLNVLANLAGKSYGQIFREFEGKQDPGSVQGSGDVKYHLGTEGEFTTEGGKKTGVYLAANPSHLEAVNPVLEGIVRAKQDRLNLPGDTFSVLPVLMHGDAAFAGQGVVAETLHLSQLRGYRTGGTIHIIINNQVGFTTSPFASRSSVYCTDVARMVQAPIFHVNGDDPEACVRVAELAYEFRKDFTKDVVIDMVCYRRRGHNEGDDPSMTQPLMYELIEAKRSVRKLYTEALIGRGDISVQDAEEALRDYQRQLEQVFTETKAALKDTSAETGFNRPHAQEQDSAHRGSSFSSAISTQRLEAIGDAFVAPPDGFTVHPKLAQLMERRQEMTRSGGADWAMGELLAIGSLLMEGIPVRLSGQDSRRGTFVQRHAVLTDKKDGSEWGPLQTLSDDQAKFWIYDSLLSEFAAMGFEYGYSVERPDALVMWEAQFGDFVNGAQTIIDEFISSSEQKWNQNSSVVLLLPHGYEGQGPDHSSARIERFLGMCAEDNMRVAYPSTPASYFHLLRRQAHARPRKPLIVFTPKGMLRQKAAASNPEDFTSGVFEPVLGERNADQIDTANVDLVLLASSKLVHDLGEARTTREDDRAVILAVEQFYPVPGRELAKALSAYPDAQIRWVQNEPANQGAWPFMALNLPDDLAHHGEKRQVSLISRPPAASPATGSSKVHAIEQEDLFRAAFDR